jgi:hypothetical protein
MRQARGPLLRAYFPPEFYDEIVREIDPGHSVSDEALAKFNEIADDFVRGVIVECLKLTRLKDSPDERSVITPDDIHYILQSRFGMTLSGASGPIPSRVAAPTDEYREKLRTVRASASGRED